MSNVTLGYAINLWSMRLELNIWTVIGFLGQFFFMMRFVVQWIATERKRESVVPVAFWYLSIVGSAILLVYSIYLKNPVFTLGFVLNTGIYLRNLYFIHRKPQPAPVATERPQVPVE